MSDQLQEMQANIVAAVQQELTRFSKEVDGALKKLKGELNDADAARRELAQQITCLTDLVEASQTSNESFRDDLQAALEQRLDEYVDKAKRRHDELNDRLGRVVDEANVGIATAVESAARPVLKELRDRQGSIESRVDDLDESLRMFDEQAGRMAEHINTVTVAIDERLGQVTDEVLANFDDREATLVGRIDEPERSRRTPPVAHQPCGFTRGGQEVTDPRGGGLKRRVAEFDSVGDGIDGPERSGRTGATGSDKRVDHAGWPVRSGLHRKRNQI